MAYEQLEALRQTLRGLNRVLILPHNDPDPDAIAAALALRHLLTERLDVEGLVAYEGIIGRAENKALMRYLGNPFRHLTNADARRSGTVALVDTQPGAGNNPLQSGRSPVIVIDHHPYREETGAVAFADVRPGVGATSTILTEYLQGADLEPPPWLATALFYGIKTDTLGLGRGAGQADMNAYFYLQPRIDVDALAEIERAQVPVEYFRSFDAALHAARAYNGVLIAYIGQMGYPDLAAEMADLLVRVEGTRWIICIGVYRDGLILSVRTRSRQGGAGKLAQHLVGVRGTAGGHGTMGAGHLLLDNADPEQLAEQISRRALQFLKVPPDKTGKPLI
jgi:nanoRNase/pAp phosphatase (c-di-AMP/oligoRNAs hydrolase)